MSTLTVFAGAGAAPSSRTTAPARRISFFIRVPPPRGLGLSSPLSAVTDSHGIAPRLEVTRARLVRGHVHAIRKRSLLVRGREDPAGERPEPQLLDGHPLAELRTPLQVDRAAGKRMRPAELREEPRGGRPRQRELRPYLDGDGLARCRLPFRRVGRENSRRRGVREGAA